MPGGQFRCPICRQETAVPKDGPQAFKNNLFVSHVEDILRSKQSSRPCQVCELSGSCDSYASCLCVECADFLCDSCAEGHRKTRFTINHKILGIDDIRRCAASALRHADGLLLMTATFSGKYDEQLRAAQLPRCQLHVTESLRFYCTRCELLICSECQVLSHTSHPCAGLEKARTKCEAQLKDFLLPVQQRKDLMENKLSELSAGKTELSAVEKYLEGSIQERGALLHRIINNEQEQIFAKVRELCHSNHKAFDSLIERIQMEILGVRTTCDFVKSLVAHGNDSEILYHYKDILKRLKELQSITDKLDQLEMPNSNVKFPAPDQEMTNRLVHQAFGELSLPVFKQRIFSEKVLEFSVGSSDPVHSISSMENSNIVACIGLLHGESRVLVFETNGQLKHSLQSPEMTFPWDVAAHGREIYITACFKNHVYVFDQVTLALKAKIPLGFAAYSPGLAVSREGHIYVCHSDKNAVYCRRHADRFQFLLSMEGVNSPDSLQHLAVVPGKDNIAACNSPQSCVNIYSRNGQMLESYGKEGSGQACLNSPQGLCADLQGNVLVTDRYNHRVHLISPSGAFAGYVATKEQGLQNPISVSVNQDGIALIGTTSGNILLYRYEVR